MKIYQRFIEVWEGPEEELVSFLHQLNNKLTGNWSQDNIQFLYLEIFKDNNRLGIQMHLKNVDKNRYMSTIVAVIQDGLGPYQKANLSELKETATTIRITSPK